MLGKLLNEGSGSLTERQQRERDFHRAFAAEHAYLVDTAVSDEVLGTTPRRWWNAFWCMYDHVLAAQVAGRRVLIPGCGFAYDAIRISRLGAEVCAFDISVEIVDIARARAERQGEGAIRFDVMTAEAMSYPDNHFDMILFVDILHHVDIAATMSEARRVLKPGGLMIGDELYTHSALQRVRDSRLVTRHLHPWMAKWIYRRETPYITMDEHKIDQHEFALVSDSMIDRQVDYFGLFEGRLMPNDWRRAAQIDRMIMRAAGGFGSLLGGRVVFSGKVRK